MIHSTTPSVPLKTESSANVAAELRERFQRLQALDNSSQDCDPRESYISVKQSGGQLEAIAYTVSEGFEYQARLKKDGQVVSGECASVSQDGQQIQILASHYDSQGQRQSVEMYPDITNSEPVRGIENVAPLSQSECREWTVDEAGRGLLSQKDAQDESYYYGHNFDLMFQKS